MSEAMEMKAREETAGHEKPVVREQAVSLIELFYDLVYVYAISKMTSLFDGVPLDSRTFFRYFVSSFAVLQAWMYMTNYINRFERKRAYENVAIVVNMCAAVFMSNTISTDWSVMFPEFNTSMFVILGTVAVLYALRLREGASARGMAAFSIKTLLPVCAAYLVVVLFRGTIDPQVALAVDVAAILFGIFGPALVDRASHLDVSLISFPHLAERFELITIITFGETVVTVAEVAERFGFGVVSLASFTCVVAMFCCYVVFMHDLVDHHQLRRGLRMIYCHFFIVIAANLLTVSFNLLIEDPHPTPAVCTIAAVAVAAFFAFLFGLAKYLRSDVMFTNRDWVMLAGVVVLGCALTFSGLAGGVAAFLAGPLVASAGCLALLLAKHRATLVD